MGKHLSPFEALDGLKGIYAATRENLRCTAIRLRSGGLCLFSPVRGLGDKAIASLKQLGNVEVLLAPNHWHNMGLHEYAKAFPAASICTSTAASTRLALITQLRFEGLTGLQQLLPRNMRMTIPPGLKTGEVWLSVANAQQHAWIVVDAFCGPTGKTRNPGNEPGILGTFPKFGLADRRVYLDWLEHQVGSDKPTVIVPCHGAVLRDPQLPSKVRRLIASKL